MDRKTYEHILASDGRRIANRAAFASLREKGEQAELDAFYSMYGSEDDLPEHERVRAGNPRNCFDPTGWHSFYVNEQWAAVARSLCPDRDWAKELAESTPEQGCYLVALFHDQKALDAATDETMDWLRSLRPTDIVALFVLLHRRWPDVASENLQHGEKEIASMFLGITK
ncbi:hypothetical protein [Paraburkholderia graminis]|uniref:hypothetical protein n=1 Tax=Paraburkholderia graminis TaxID=60548 RepID=UPI0038B9FA67